MPIYARRETRWAADNNDSQGDSTPPAFAAFYRSRDCEAEMAHLTASGRDTTIRRQGMPDIEQAAFENAMATAAGKASVGGASVAVVFGLTANEIAAYGGLIVAIAGMVVNVIYRRREYRLKKEFYRRGGEPAE